MRRIIVTATDRLLHRHTSPSISHRLQIADLQQRRSRVFRRSDLPSHTPLFQSPFTLHPHHVLRLTYIHPTFTNFSYSGPRRVHSSYENEKTTFKTKIPSEKSFSISPATFGSLSTEKSFTRTLSREIQPSPRRLLPPGNLIHLDLRQHSQHADEIIFSGRDSRRSSVPAPSSELQPPMAATHFCCKRACMGPKGPGQSSTAGFAIVATQSIQCSSWGSPGSRLPSGLASPRTKNSISTTVW